MATTQELLSLQRKIALDSYHQTINQPNKGQRRLSGATFLRPRSLSISGADSIKSSRTAKSSKSNKSRSKDCASLTLLHTSSSHLPSIPKPFKKIFHAQTRSFTTNPYKKSKSKSKSKSKYNSDPQHLKSINIKKLIDKKLLQQYRQYVEERVEMLRSRAFPHDVLYQLPQYRADLTDISNKAMPNICFSRHKECDQLIQAQLLKAEKHALQHTTKLHSSKKILTLKSIKKGIVAPIQPIKNLFATSNKPKTDEPISPLEEGTNHKSKDKDKEKSPSDDSEKNLNVNWVLPPDTNLEDKFNIIPRQYSDDISPPNTNELPPVPPQFNGQPLSLIMQDEQKDTSSMEVTCTPFPSRVRKSAAADNISDIEPEETPILHPISSPNRHRTELLRRLKSTHPRSVSDIDIDPSSPTPPHFFTMRTLNVCNSEPALEKHLPSSTPSWALRESSEEIADTNLDINEENVSNGEEIRNDFEVLGRKYNELELLCGDFEIRMRAMQESMDEQKKRINSMTKEMHRMEDKLKKVDYETNDKNNNEEDMKLAQEEIHETNNKKYFDYEYFGYFTDMFKEKIFEKDIISFQRSTWENIYLSLFAYFMNGLMVSFNFLTQSWMLIGFIFKFLMCCFCKKNKPHSNHPNKQNKSYSLLSHSKKMKRRNKTKKRNRIRRWNNRNCMNNYNNNVLRENSQEQDSPSFD